MVETEYEAVSFWDGVQEFRESVYDFSAEGFWHQVVEALVSGRAEPDPEYIVPADGESVWVAGEIVADDFGFSFLGAFHPVSYYSVHPCFDDE